MKRFLAAALLAGAALVASANGAEAQSALQVRVVSACSAQSWPLNVDRPLTQTQTGNLCTNATGGGGGGGTSSNFGAAFPTAGTAIGVKNGANMVNLIADSGSGLVVAGEGTAGSAAGGILTVQGVASMTPLLVTPAANSAVNVAQVNGVTVLTGAGAVGTGSARIAVGQDTTTVAGAAPLTTGIYVTGPSAAALATAANQTTINTSIGLLVTDAHFQNVVGTKNAGAAAANSFLDGLVYNSTPLTLTNTQQASLQGDANGYLKVNVAAGGAGGGAVYGPTAVGSAAANPPVLFGGTANATSTGNVQVAKVDSNGSVYVAGGVTDGTAVASALYNSIAAVAQTTPSACTTATQCFLSQNPDNRALRINLYAGTTGGSSNYVLEPTASDNHAVIKNGQGTLRGLQVFNNSGTINYGRFYNLGTGFNGCNSATGLLYEFHIPANTSDAGDNVPLPANGVNFSTGLSICVTGGYGQTNTANATASAISLDAQYD